MTCFTRRWQTRTHCCSFCFLGRANGETFFVSQTQILCPRQILRAGESEILVSVTMTVSSFATAYSEINLFSSSYLLSISKDNEDVCAKQVFMITVLLTDDFL